jgi:hypothetical protein
LESQGQGWLANHLSQNGVAASSMRVDGDGHHGRNQNWEWWPDQKQVGCQADVQRTRDHIQMGNHGAGADEELSAVAC